MNLEFSGFYRNHGRKSMIYCNLLRSKVIEGEFPFGDAVCIRLDELYDGVELQFSTDLRLNGKQFGRLRLSSLELAHLLRTRLRSGH